MAEDMTFLPKAEVLTLEELDRCAAPSCASACASSGSPAASRWCGERHEPFRRSGVIWRPARSTS